MKNVAPIIQHALDAQIVEQSAEAFEYRVKKCLRARVFRDQDAGDIGYAMVCYPDYPVAKSMNPKLRLIRTQTLMRGNDSCSLRYVMDACPGAVSGAWSPYARGGLATTFQLRSSK